ncbi:titin-like [Coccinella septempunctata]|uniref:titin-like n=1 Tax=Coccinella septempunctata TaxID=41139 RepID=UPI001D07E7F8|nr:titin-like [Coccinella septempunctata]
MEVYYKPSDIVWVKLGPFWWPGEVVDKTSVPEDLIESLKREPVAIVKFFDDDGYYEFVKTPEGIHPYNCERKYDFIKKGMDAFRAKNPKMTSFPKDVSAAEVKTGGNANILSDPVFTIERKRNYAAEIFGSPTVKKPRESHKGRAIKSEPIITHRRFLGYDDYEARVLIPTEEDAEKTDEDTPTVVTRVETFNKFTCPICQFSTDRLGILMKHTSCHVKDVSFQSRQPIKKQQKRKRKKALSDDDLSGDEKKTKTKRKYTKKKVDESVLADDERSENDISFTAKDSTIRKYTKKPAQSKIEEKKDICIDIIADWDDESNHEDSNEKDTTVDTTLNESQEISEVTANNLSVESSFGLELTDEDLDSTRITKDITEDPELDTPTEQPDKPLDDKAEKSPNKSCFDFEEDEEETKIPDATSGRKIPRVIPISERRKTVEMEDENVDEEEEKRKKKILEESEELAKLIAPSTEEDRETENLEKTYQSLMDSTEHLDIPDVPNILKTEQNFHAVRTVKYPDKHKGESSDLIEAEVTEERTALPEKPEKLEEAQSVEETIEIIDTVDDVTLTVEALPESIEEKKLKDEESEAPKEKGKSKYTKKGRKSSRTKPEITESAIDALLMKQAAESENSEKDKDSSELTDKKVPLDIPIVAAEEVTTESNSKEPEKTHEESTLIVENKTLDNKDVNQENVVAEEIVIADDEKLETEVIEEVVVLETPTVDEPLSVSEEKNPAEESVAKIENKVEMDTEVELNHVEAKVEEEQRPDTKRRKTLRGYSRSSNVKEDSSPRRGRSKDAETSKVEESRRSSSPEKNKREQQKSARKQSRWDRSTIKKDEKTQDETSFDQKIPTQEEINNVILGTVEVKENVTMHTENSTLKIESSKENSENNIECISNSESNSGPSLLSVPTVENEQVEKENSQLNAKTTTTKEEKRKERPKHDQKEEKPNAEETSDEISEKNEKDRRSHRSSRKEKRSSRSERDQKKDESGSTPEDSSHRSSRSGRRSSRHEKGKHDSSEVGKKDQHDEHNVKHSKDSSNSRKSGSSKAAPSSDLEVPSSREQEENVPRRSSRKDKKTDRVDPHPQKSNVSPVKEVVNDPKVHISSSRSSKRQSRSSKNSQDSLTSPEVKDTELPIAKKHEDGAVSNKEENVEPQSSSKKSAKPSKQDRIDPIRDLFAISGHISKTKEQKREELKSIFSFDYDEKDLKKRRTYGHKRKLKHSYEEVADTGTSEETNKTENSSELTQTSTEVKNETTEDKMKETENETNSEERKNLVEKQTLVHSASETTLEDTQKPQEKMEHVQNELVIEAGELQQEIPVVQMPETLVREQSEIGEKTEMKPEKELSISKNLGGEVLDEKIEIPQQRIDHNASEDVPKQTENLDTKEKTNEAPKMPEEKKEETEKSTKTVVKKQRKPSRWDQKEKTETSNNHERKKSRWDKIKNEDVSQPHSSEVEAPKVTTASVDNSQTSLYIDETSQKEMSDIFSGKETSDLADKNAAQIELIFGSSPLPVLNEDNMFVEKNKELESDQKESLDVSLEENTKNDATQVENASKNSSFELAPDLMDSVESQVARITHYEEPNMEQKSSNEVEFLIGQKVGSIFDTPEKGDKATNALMNALEETLDIATTSAEKSNTELEATSPNKKASTSSSAPKAKKTYLLTEKARTEKEEKSLDATKETTTNILDPPIKSVDKTNEVATKLTNPKKRFVKSFEDFELNQQREKSLEAERANSQEAKSETSSLVAEKPKPQEAKPETSSLITEKAKPQEAKPETSSLITEKAKPQEAKPETSSLITEKAKPQEAKPETSSLITERAKPQEAKTTTSSLITEKAKPLEAKSETSSLINEKVKPQEPKPDTPSLITEKAKPQQAKSETKLEEAKPETSLITEQAKPETSSLITEKAKSQEVKPETSLITGKSPIVFKLKKQFLSKISSIFDEADEKKETRVLPRIKTIKNDHTLLPKKKIPCGSAKTETITTKNIDVTETPKTKTEKTPEIVNTVEKIDIEHIEKKTEDVDITHIDDAPSKSVPVSEESGELCQKKPETNVTENKDLTTCISPSKIHSTPECNTVEVCEVSFTSDIETSEVLEEWKPESKAHAPAEKRQHPDAPELIVGEHSNLLAPVIEREHSNKHEEDHIDISKTEIITKNFPLDENKKEETEYVSIDGNLTVVSEKELAEGQVEITASMPSKKPMTLLNFSMDFSDDSSDASFEAFRKEKIQNITESLDSKSVEDEVKEKEVVSEKESTIKEICEIIDNKEQMVNNESEEVIVESIEQEPQIDKHEDKAAVNSGSEEHEAYNNKIETIICDESKKTIDDTVKSQIVEKKETVLEDISNVAKEFEIDSGLSSAPSIQPEIKNEKTETQKDKIDVVKTKSDKKDSSKVATSDLLSVSGEVKPPTKSPESVTVRGKGKDATKKNDRKSQLFTTEQIPVVNEPMVIYNTAKSSTVTDMCDLEDHIPSQIVCTKINEEVMKVAGINNELSKERAMPKNEPEMSKLLSRLTSDKKEDPISKIKEAETKTRELEQISSPKNLLKAAIKSKTANTSTALPPKSMNKAIILSEKIIRPAREVAAIVRKRAYEDVEDIEPYVITKTPKLEPKKEETFLSQKVPSSSTSKIPVNSPKQFVTNANKQIVGIRKSGKAKILNQTIIRPASETIPTNKLPIGAEDNVDFDINSMPIVLSDELLTPETLENMPIVLGEQSQKASPASENMKIIIEKKTPTNAKLVTKTVPMTSTPAAGSPTVRMPVLKRTTPKILQTPRPAQKIIRQVTPVVGSKTSKFVVVSESANRPSQMMKKQPNLLRKTVPVTCAASSTASAPSESTGHKIMIFTNQQGKQQRLLLTPAQQKMFGMQLPGKTVVKSATAAQKSQLAKVQSTTLASTSKLSGQVQSPKLVKTTVGASQVASPQMKIVPPRKTTQKIHMPGQPVNKPQQKTILITNQHGQTVRKIQGTNEALLDKQVAEQLEAIKVSSMKAQLKQQEANARATITSKPHTVPARKPVVKRPEPKQTVVAQPKLPHSSTSTISGPSRLNEPKVPPLTPIRQEKKQEDLPKQASQSKPAQNKPDRPLHQLVIQDNMGNQTTITEGQILALPSETVDGQPQSYMLVTLDETGNLTPLNNEALMSLDPSLAGLAGGDLSNMVLQMDAGTSKDNVNQTAQLQAAPPTTTVQEKPKPEVQQQIVPSKPEQRVVPPVEQAAAQVQVTCNINGEPGQQIILTGDPVATQKFLDSLSDGSTDLANILAGAEGNSFLIQADGQQILINTEPNEAAMLQANANIEQGSPMFSTHAVKNQDILAAALADTDVFQQDHVTSQGKLTHSQLSPGQTLFPMNVGNVLETSLTLNSPIMTPLEVPSTNSKRIPDEEADILTTHVPKNVDLPITITDPNISQTVSHQQVLMASDLQSNLELSLPISETISVTSDMNSPSFVYSLPNLGVSEHTEISQKNFTGSMPLLTDDMEESHASTQSGVTHAPANLTRTEPSAVPSKKHNIARGSRQNLISRRMASGGTFMEEGLCTLGAEMCSSLSEPPPEMFDIPMENEGINFLNNAKSQNASEEKSSISSAESGLLTDDNSLEIPVQSQIVSDFKDSSQSSDSSSSVSQDKTL